MKPTASKFKRYKERARLGSAGLSTPLLSYGSVNRVSKSDFAAAIVGWNAICVDKVADATASTKRTVRFQKSQTEKVDAPLNYWAVQLLSGKPNPFMTKSQLLTLFEKWRILTGNAFLWTPTHGGKFPVQIWVLPSHAVSIGTTRGGTAIEYRLNTPHGTYMLDAKEVLHSKNMEPSRDFDRSLFLGTPVIDKIIDTIHADSELARYIRNYYESDAVAPLIYVDDGEEFQETEQWEHYKSTWNNKFPRHQLYAYLKKGATIQPLTATGTGATAASIQTTQIDDDVLEKIAACHGMSAALVKGNFNNRSTAEVYRDEFHGNVVNKKAQAFAEELTAHLQQWDSAIIVEAELYAPSDQEFALKRMKEELSMGVLTPNEYLISQGKEPFEGGDVRLVPTALQSLELVVNPPKSPTPTPTTPKQAEPTPVEGEEPATTFLRWFKETKTIDPFQDKDFVDAYWKGYDDIAETGAALIKRAVNRAMDALEKEVLGNVVAKVVSGAVEKDGVDDTVELFDVEAWATVFAEETDPERKELLIDTMKAALKDAGENWDDVSSQFDEQIKAAQTASSEKIKTAVGTVKEQLQELLQKLKDKPVSEVKAAIKDKFSQYTDSGAERIAATTANFTTNRAQRDAWDAFDVRRLWLSQRDKNVRGAHADADGQEANEAGLFSVGGEFMPHPGGGSDPKNNIWCRCYQRPRLKEEAVQNMYKHWINTGRVR